MRGPLDIHQFLLAHDVHHEIVRLPRNAGCSQGATSLAHALGLPEHRCVAVHAFHAPTKAADRLALLLAPADAVIDDAVVGPRLAKTTGPAAVARHKGESPDEGIVFVRAGSELVSRRTDYLAGHVAPLLLPSDVEVIALQSLADLATTVVYTPTGDIGTALGLRALDLIVLSRATVLPSSDGGMRRRPVRIDLNPARGRLDLDGDSPATTPPSRRAPAPRRAAASVTPVAS